MRNVPSQLKRLNIAFWWMCVAFSSESIILIGAEWVLVFTRYLPFLSGFCTKHNRIRKAKLGDWNPSLMTKVHISFVTISNSNSHLSSKERRKKSSALSRNCFTTFIPTMVLSTYCYPLITDYYLFEIVYNSARLRICSAEPPFYCFSTAKHQVKVGSAQFVIFYLSLDT